MTFRFPFRFPFRFGQAPQRACLRHVRTSSLRDGSPYVVLPLNVMTAALAKEPEVKILTYGQLGQTRLLEVVEARVRERDARPHRRRPAERRGERVHRREGGVGCRERAAMLCTPDELQANSPGSRHNTDDIGSGYYYGELRFDCAC